MLRKEKERKKKGGFKKRQCKTCDKIPPGIFTQKDNLDHFQ